MTSKKIALYGGSFNPPGIHHREIARHLARRFDEVIIVPCGPRPDKPVTNDVAPIFRAAMVDMTFRDLANVRVELFDLESQSFTPSLKLDQAFSTEGEVWHVIGADLVRGGASGEAPIQKHWNEGEQFWRECRFAVITRPGYKIDKADLPPHYQICEVDVDGASSTVRENIYRHEPIGSKVLPSVSRYIAGHKLYQGLKPPRMTELLLRDARLKVIVDKKNPEAVRIGQRFENHDEEDPELIVAIGGDGTILRTIREYWRLRIPFYGINAGTIGFLLNPPQDTDFRNQSLVLQQLPLLRVEMFDSDRRMRSALAFNDAWVERNTGQSAWIQVKVDGKERLSKLVGDGALIATAAGSGSYARAMGAPPMPFDTPAILLVGSNVLKPPFWKPVILNFDAEVELINLDPDKRPWRAYIDGVLQENVVRMRTCVSKIAAVELAFDHDLHPAEKLVSIQFPPPEA